jgi:hypothetical protein
VVTPMAEGIAVDGHSSLSGTNRVVLVSVRRQTKADDHHTALVVDHELSNHTFVLVDQLLHLDDHLLQIGQTNVAERFHQVDEDHTDRAKLSQPTFGPRVDVPNHALLDVHLELVFQIRLQRQLHHRRQLHRHFDLIQPEAGPLLDTQEVALLHLGPGRVGHVDLAWLCDFLAGADLIQDVA